MTVGEILGYLAGGREESELRAVFPDDTRLSDSPNSLPIIAFVDTGTVPTPPEALCCLFHWVIGGYAHDGPMGKLPITK